MTTPRTPAERAVKRLERLRKQAATPKGELVAIPGIFWRDHADRAPYDPGAVPPTPVRETTLRVHFRRDDPGLALLAADARYCANPDSMDACPEHLRRSALRTLAALAAAGITK